MVLLPSPRICACFMLGVSLYTPIISYTLSIDFFEQAFPDMAVPVKLQACFSSAFFCTQLACHLLDRRLPLSRAQRIELRHLAVSCIMAFIIIWLTSLVENSSVGKKLALRLLLLAVTLTGIMDGIAVGAIFGEAAVLGPSCAHALVAGTAGVLPLLSCLRAVLKGALPPTSIGLQQSVVAYYAVTTVIVLSGLVVYIVVVLPAVTRIHVSEDDDESRAAVTMADNTQRGGMSSSHATRTSSIPHSSHVLLLVPTLSRKPGLHLCRNESAASTVSRSHTLQRGYTLSSSIRGVSLLVQTVDMGPTVRSRDLLTGAVAGTAWHDAGPTTLPATTNAATALRTARSHPLSTSTSLRHTASHGSSCDAAISCVEDPGTITISTHGGGDQQPRKKTVQYRKMLSAPVIRSHSISRRDLDDVVSTGHAPELLMTLLEQTKAEEPLEPRYFKPGQSVWRSNALLLQDNWPFVLTILLTCLCNYGLFPAFIVFAPNSAVLGTWYPVLLVAVYGWSDFAGKLLPVWHPDRPKATLLAISAVRVVIFNAYFAVILWLRVAEWAFFLGAFLLGFTMWYDTIVFALACEGHHPEDAYQVESLLAMQVDVGIAFGSVVSLAWSAGPWLAKPV